MSILQDRTNMSARVSRAASNALKVDLQVQDGVIAAHARQKGGVGVLLGFKNGGKANYSLEGKGVHIDIDVAATSTVTRDGSVLGRIVGKDSAAQIEDAGGSVLAHISPHQGPKSDSAYIHPLTAASGERLGSLTVMRTSAGWSTVEVMEWLSMIDFVGSGLKAPSAGALLKLERPVDDVLGDVLAAALVDASVLPRVYLA